MSVFVQEAVQKEGDLGILRDANCKELISLSLSKDNSAFRHSAHCDATAKDTALNANMRCRI